MADNVFSLTGVNEIDKKLAGLPVKVVKTLARRALRTVMKPIKSAAKANSPNRTGAMRKAIKVRAMTKLRNKRTTVGIQVATSKEAFQGKQFYAWFIEKGWMLGKRQGNVIHETAQTRRKDGSFGKRRRRTGTIYDARTRRVAGQHPMKRAYDAHKSEVRAKFAEEILKSVEDAASGG